MGLLREQCVELRKGHLRHCCNQSGWRLVGGFHGMLQLFAKYSGSSVWWEDTLWKAVRKTLQRTSYTVWRNGRTSPYCVRKTCRDCISSAGKSFQIFSSAGDMLVADIEELQKMDASELHARRLNAQEVSTPMKGETFVFPVADGSVKNSGGDQDLRTSTLIRDNPDRG